jgi:lysophospholipase L1-like esterase
MISVRASPGLVLGALGLPILLGTARFARCVRRGRVLASRPPLARPLRDATALIAVAGDSTAVGTGARHARDTLAGMLAADFPRASVVNVAQVGARVTDLPRQLAALPGAADALLISIGGNDVLRMTPRRALESHVAAALDAAHACARLVVLVTSPNVGLAPAFFWPMGTLLSERARKVRDVLRDACARSGAHHVDFFEEERDLFSADPDRFFAPDLLHPSGTSYRYCYGVICRSTPLAAFATGGARPTPVACAAQAPQIAAGHPAGALAARAAGCQRGVAVR